MARTLLALALSTALARPCAAGDSTPAATAEVSVATAAAKPPPLLRIVTQPGAGPQGAPSVGIGVGIAEGKPLEMLVWGGAGAVAGSIAGPFGAIVGAAAGAAGGLLFSLFVEPRYGAKAKPASP